MKPRQKGGQAATPCPCGGVPLDARYIDCCEPYLEGRAIPAHAEALMRSRYTAYTLVRSDYLRATWHASTRPDDLVLEPSGAPHATKWLGLSVHGHTLLDETHAQVLFTARYREAGRAHRLEEHSRFVFEQGRWFYVDGEVSLDRPAAHPRDLGL